MAIIKTHTIGIIFNVKPRPVRIRGREKEASVEGESTKPKSVFHYQRWER